MAGRSRRMAPAIGISLVVLAAVVAALGSSALAFDATAADDVELRVSGAGCPPDASVALLVGGVVVESTTADELGRFELLLERDDPDAVLQCGSFVLRAVVTTADGDPTGGLGVVIGLIVPLVLLLVVVVTIIQRRQRMQARQAVWQVDEAATVGREDVTVP